MEIVSISLSEIHQVFSGKGRVYKHSDDQHIGLVHRVSLKEKMLPELSYID